MTYISDSLIDSASRVSGRNKPAMETALWLAVTGIASSINSLPTALDLKRELHSRVRQLPIAPSVGSACLLFAGDLLPTVSIVSRLNPSSKAFRPNSFAWRRYGQCFGRQLLRPIGDAQKV